MTADSRVGAVHSGDMGRLPWGCAALLALLSLLACSEDPPSTRPMADSGRPVLAVDSGRPDASRDGGVAPRREEDAGSAEDGGRPLDASSPPLGFRAVTFNTGTNDTLPHDSDGDGYGRDEAAVSDEYYGDGLAWAANVEATRLWFTENVVDVVAFQEIFHSPDCVDIPTRHHRGFVCESWEAGDPTVAQVLLGEGYQIACHQDRDDKCLGVRRAFGTIRGCDSDFCANGLDGARVRDCGGGSRVGRGVIDLAAGGEITVVTYHGTSGIGGSDQECRVKQIDQIFVDLDGEPAANGERNLIFGDFNTDPFRAGLLDASARRWLEFAGDGSPFTFISPAGPDAPPSYSGLFNIDHIVSDAFRGTCRVPGVDAGEPDVLSTVYFDHKPVVCDLVF